MGEPAPYGLRAEVGAQVRHAVRSLMVDTLQDDVLHAEIVAAGRSCFRKVFGKDMGPFFAHNRSKCDDLADVTFRFFERQWDQKHVGVSAGVFLDAITPVSPPTETEIEEAWELEIGSSESALRQFYEGSARRRKGRDLGARLQR